METNKREYDLYLIEVYKQAGENARMYAGSRFSNLNAFLTYMSFLIAALAIIVSSQTPFFSPKLIGSLICALGIVVGILFFALEVRHHYYWQYYEGRVVKNIELEMGIRQYPKDAEFSDKKRNWIRTGLWGIRATQATYGVYISSVVFFGVVLMAFLLK